MTYAGEIAARLRHAHQQRTRREDEDMAGRARKTKDEPQEAAGIWDDDPFVRALNLSAELGKVLGDIAASGHAPDENAGRVAELERELEQARALARTATENEQAALDQLADLQAAQQREAAEPQASAVTAERVVELERQLAEANEKLTAYSGQIRELERQLAEAQDVAADALRHRDAARADLAEERRAHDAWEQTWAKERELLATAYVAREVPWSDVAAGMMTLSKEEHPRPWMVEHSDVSTPRHVVRLRNGGESFDKIPKPGETVRVLVPYVTPEQAEELVREQLGGRA